MKNMKKLLGAMAALGFATVAGINVVACSKPSTPSNDLTKSFNSSYTKTIVATDTADLAAVGLAASGTAGSYTFTFGNITDAGIQPIITATSGSVPVNKGVTIADPTTLTATTANDEIAQVKSNTANGTIVATGDSSTVQYTITLELWKAGSDLKYVDQQVSMDITININTAIVKIDLSGLTDQTISSGVSQGDVGEFTTALKSALSKIDGYGAIANDANVTLKKGDGSAALDAGDIVTNATLSVQVVAANSINFTNGNKTISVNLTVTPAKKDLSGLTDQSVSGVTGGSVDSFTSLFKTALATQSGYSAIATDDKVTITNGSGQPLQSGDIKAGTLSVTVSASGSANFNDGQKVLTATIATS